MSTRCERRSARIGGSGRRSCFRASATAGAVFPKDTQALLKSARDKGYDFKILRAVEAVNDQQKSRLFDKMEAHFTSMKGRTIALWGLAFKPRTDDMREAPAIVMIERLLAAGATVRAYDPEAARDGAADIRRPDRAVGEELRRAERTPMPWPSSPSGTNSGSPISKRCAD